MGAASPAGSPVSGAASSGFVGAIDFDAWKNYFAIVGGRIEYGLYPQEEATLKASEISRLSLCPKEFASYLHVDGKLYAEFANKYYLVQPIRWKILKREGDKALVMAEDALHFMMFKSKKSFAGYGNYANSDMREFLTKEFARVAFPDGGKRILAYPGAPDRISIPSKEELNNPALGLGGSGIARAFKLTDYAQANGAYGYPDCATRTRSRNKDYLSVFSTSGSLHEEYGNQSYGVRPILWLNIKP